MIFRCPPDKKNFRLSKRHFLTLVLPGVGLYVVSDPRDCNRPREGHPKMKLYTGILLATAAVVLIMPVADANAQAVAHRRGSRPNAAGGTTAARGTAVVGPNGGKAVHGRAVATDSAGDVKSVRGTAFSGPNGTKGVRGASNTVSADGDATHKSGGFVQGPNGARAGRAGETTLNPDGSAPHRGAFPPPEPTV